MIALAALSASRLDHLEHAGGVYGYKPTIYCGLVGIHHILRTRRHPADRCYQVYRLSTCTLTRRLYIIISAMQPLTSHHLLPPFPDSIKTAPLVSVSFESLEKGDGEASATFFKACKELGFFYLDLVGSELGENIIAEAEKLNRVQQDFFKLPNGVKDVYGRPHLHPFYAYRFNELAIKDENGVSLRGESYNVRTSFEPHLVLVTTGRMMAVFEFSTRFRLA